MLQKLLLIDLQTELQAGGSSRSTISDDIKSQDCNLHPSPVLFNDFKAIISHNSPEAAQQDRPGKSKYPYFTEKSTETKLILKGNATVKTGPQIARAGGEFHQTSGLISFYA